jgi:hypothetical protein
LADKEPTDATTPAPTPWLPLPQLLYPQLSAPAPLPQQRKNPGRQRKL